jgi:hypothetical protein
VLKAECPALVNIHSCNTCYRCSVERLSAFGIRSKRLDEGNEGGNTKPNTLLYQVLRVISVVQCAINCMKAEYCFTQPYNSHCIIG